jgi:hypothetical protein
MFVNVPIEKNFKLKIQLEEESSHSLASLTSAQRDQIRSATQRMSAAMGLLRSQNGRKRKNGRNQADVFKLQYWEICFKNRKK